VERSIAEVVRALLVLAMLVPSSIMSMLEHRRIRSRAATAATTPSPVLEVV
jgi:hypothetical protein